MRPGAAPCGGCSGVGSCCCCMACCPGCICCCWGLAAATSPFAGAAAPSRFDASASRELLLDAAPELPQGLPPAPALVVAVVAVLLGAGGGGGAPRSIAVAVSIAIGALTGRGNPAEVAPPIERVLSCCAPLPMGPLPPPAPRAVNTLGWRLLWNTAAAAAIRVSPCCSSAPEYQPRKKTPYSESHDPPHDLKKGVSSGVLL
mmetsp:Transcript_10449/g.31489  ORF Transcript_10449/g.31489 Transcript_10449/m.31489 type:complete len:202 (+) Transcript_10449:452-1057(+)